MTDIKSWDLLELKKELEAMGEKPFRAKQIYDWVHKKLCESFSEMTNLPESLRERLAAEYDLTVLRAVRVQTSKIDGTKKFLFELSDRNVIESVLMHYKHGNSVCISSQVGCRMGCRFCASTVDGMVRNLTTAEMLEQVYAIQRMTKERVSNVVVMGSGEPMDNYDNVIKFIRLLSDENGLHISQRNITVSTCGIVPQLWRLAKEGLQITLAVSLHAPNNEKRRELMPIAKKYSLSELMEACRFYYERTGRRLTFEYSLVSGINDAPSDAAQLSALLKGLSAHINLIPVNPIRERDFAPSDRAAVADFKNKLEKTGINVTIRREMGRDIDGACGQLRRRYHEEKAGILAGKGEQ